MVSLESGRIGPSRCFVWILGLIFMILLTGPEATEAAANFTVFTPQVDAALKLAPDWLWDTFAGIGITLGTLFAFVGARMLRTAAFFFGAFGGALLAAVVLAAIGDVESQVWLPVVIGTGVVCGVIVSCIVRLARFVMFVVLGVTISGVFVQYCLSYIEDLPDWVLYMLIGIFIVISAFLTWKSYKFMMIFATSFVGGFVVLVSTARFTRGPISLAGMWVEPEFLRACVDMTCWGPFIAGAGVFLLGLLYQLRRFTGRNKSRTKPDKKTKRELEAAEKARRQEKERFEQRIEEIRRVADQEIEQATMASRRAMEGANQEREALLRQQRQLEEEQEKLRQDRMRMEQEARIVEAEYVHFNGNVNDLPVATPAAPQRRVQLGLPVASGMSRKKPQRPLSRPPPPTPDGWGGGARPWNKCAQHQVAFDVCGCTNPRSKEQVLTELQALRAERERFEQEQKTLAERNAELKERLKLAEEAAMMAATQASIAQQKAQHEVVKSGEVEERLERERRELERLLREAEGERLEAQEQLRVLQETRKTAKIAEISSPQVVDSSSTPAAEHPEEKDDAMAVTNKKRDSTSGAVVDGSIVLLSSSNAEETKMALQEEELRLKERMAQAEGLEDTLRREIEVLQKAPQRVLTERDLGEKLLMEQQQQEQGSTVPASSTATAAAAIQRKISALHILPNVPLRRQSASDSSTAAKASPSTTSGAAAAAYPASKFASKWSNVERTYSVDERSTGAAAGRRGGSRGAAAVTADGTDADAPQNELEPVRDLFADISKLASTGFQLLLEGTVFIIAHIGKAIGMCLDAARDAQMERQEQQLRHKSQRSNQFRASNVKERFSSPVRTEDV